MKAAKFTLLFVLFLGIALPCYALSEKEQLARAHPRYTELLSHDEALEFIFGKDAQIEEKKVTLDEDTREELEDEMGFNFDPKYDKEFDFYIGKKDGNIFRYAAIEIVPGKWGPITFVIGFTPEGKVYDLAIMSYSEIRGRPARKRIFLDQYKGKSIKSRLRLKRDIHAISGATITSRGVTRGVKKMLYVFNASFLEKPETGQEQ
jgi:Na+-translocating ferredoxin:NAD+ oxidoreductase RnfG subunit